MRRRGRRVRSSKGGGRGRGGRLFLFAAKLVAASVVVVIWVRNLRLSLGNDVTATDAKLSRSYSRSKQRETGSSTGGEDASVPRDYAVDGVRGGAANSTAAAAQRDGLGLGGAARLERGGGGRRGDAIQEQKNASSSSPKGCIVYLISGDDPKYADQLGLSIFTLSKWFLSRYEMRYPVLVFHDEHLTDEQRATIRTAAAVHPDSGDAEVALPLREMPNPVDLRFVRVDIGVPDWMRNDPAIDLETYNFTCPPFPPFPLRYLQMNRFFTWRLFLHEALEGFEYYMRIDSDSCHFDVPPFNPFERMRQTGLTFAYLRQARDPKCVYEGLYEAVDEYVDRKGVKALNVPPPNVVYNGFVGVGDLSFFRSRQYLDFAEFLNTEKKGIFTARWTEQQIYPIALSLFRPESAVEKWQTQAKDGTPSGYPITTHIHGKFWRRVKPRLDRLYAAALLAENSVGKATAVAKTSEGETRNTDVSVSSTTADNIFEWNSNGDPDADELFQALVSRQNNCEAATFLVFRYRKVGMASEMHAMTVALSYAERTGRVLVVDETSWPALHEGCASNTLCCHFERISNCDVKQEDMDGAPVMPNSLLDTHSELPVLAFDLKRAIGKQRFSYTWVPAKYVERQKSIAWYRGTMLRYIMRPTNEMMKLVQSERDRMGFQDGLKSVAVHIRRTDGTKTAVRQLGSQSFLGAMANFSAEHDLNFAVIATDDINFAKNMKATNSGQLELAFIGDSYRSNVDARNKILTYRDGLRDPRPDYLSGVLDVFLAVGCNFFIGQYSSNFSRLIFELLYARLGPRAEIQSKSLDREYFTNP